MELLVVLVIISLMTAMIVPRIGGTFNKLHLKTAAKKIAASLRYARSKAVSEGVAYITDFDFGANRMLVYVDKKLSDDSNEAVNDDDEPSGNVEKEIAPKIYDLPESVRFEKAESIKGENESEFFRIFFYPSGNSSGGKITLIGENEKRLTLTIDFITGTVKLVD